ncbi:hypothetical protein CU097_001272, partial [Rhizopus azygosporus]
MSTTRFYHYLPSGDFVCDQLDTEEPEYQPKEAEATINTLYLLENVSDISISSEEEEESLDTVMAIEEFELGLARLPAMNHNFKISKADVKAQIEPKSAYKYHKEWRVNGGT